MSEHSISSIIPDNLNKLELEKRLRSFGVNSIGNKKPLQVRLTLAELGLEQTDEETESQIVQWFHHQRSELQNLCRERNIDSTGTIALMRRALVWDMAEQGFLKKKAAPKTKKKMMRMAKKIICPDTDEASIDKLLQVHKKLGKKATTIYVINSEDFSDSQQAQLAKFRKKASQKPVTDSEDSSDDEPIQLSKKSRKKTSTKSHVPKAEDSSDNKQNQLAKPKKNIAKNAALSDLEDGVEKKRTTNKSRFKPSHRSPAKDYRTKSSDQIRTEGGKVDAGFNLTTIQNELDALVGKSTRNT